MAPGDPVGDQADAGDQADVADQPDVGDQASVVRQFLDAWSEPDLERLVERLTSFVAEDVVLRQMPFAEVRGHEGLRRICAESLASMTESEIDVVAITSAGNTVFAERV